MNQAGPRFLWLLSEEVLQTDTAWGCKVGGDLQSFLEEKLFILTSIAK
jgi:hypothetical protein